MPPIIRLALVQLDVLPAETVVDRAVEAIRVAGAKHTADVVVLPESFNCPYDEQALKASAEKVPSGPTCRALSKVAEELGVYVVGGSIVERGSSGRLYITCAVWGPRGELVAKYRKVNLGDSGASSTTPTVLESAIFTPGGGLVTFTVNSVKIGLGICWDMRFPEFAATYRRKAGCQLLIYPSLCDEETGRLHWDLLARSRALDNQMFVAFCSPARNTGANLVAYGGSLIVDPWGRIVAQAGPEEDTVVGELDFELVAEIGRQIPVLGQVRRAGHVRVSSSESEEDQSSW